MSGYTREGTKGTKGKLRATEHVRTRAKSQAPATTAGEHARKESARGLVLRSLLKAEAAGQYTNLTLDTALRRTALSPEDKRLVTALFYSVVEHRITLDAVIDARSALPPSSLEPAVRQNLRMALAQLLYFDRIPDRAAICEAVSLAPKRAKGFTNALLRQFCRDGKELPLPGKGEACAYLSVKYSVAKPLTEAFLETFGAARTERLFSALAQPPAITVRVNTARLSVSEFLARVPGARPAKFAPFGAILPPNTELSALLEEGLCFVQDEASQIAVEALDAHPGMRVLDLCAAPGSKSFGAALALGGTGEVQSFDLHENKLSLIRAGAARLSLTNVTAAALDARRATPLFPGAFDRVICDVPCSGFGVLAKKPDLRYKDPADTAGLLLVQRDILAAAATCTAPGGVLVYSTCTLFPAENEAQVGAFLENHPEFTPAPFAVGEIASGGMLTLAPDTHGTDGFFVAKLQKNG